MKKPTTDNIDNMVVERDRLDKEISIFRAKVLNPTKTERKYFISLKARRKKLQHDIKVLRRKIYRDKQKALHEKLNVMTKTELKSWRVLSHKLKNIETNLSQIQSELTKLSLHSKFENLCNELAEHTTTFRSHTFEYRKILDDIESVVTKQYYRDLEVVNTYKSESSETICGTCNST